MIEPSPSDLDAGQPDQRYRQLFESSPLPLWVYDLETLRFLDVNEVACRKYGWTRDEFLAMTILEIRPPEDRAAVQASVEQTAASTFNSGFWRHRLRDGTIIQVEITSHEMLFMGRRSRFVCPLDVTLRISAEAQLRQLNEELEDRVRRRTAELEAANAHLAAAMAEAERANRAKSEFLSNLSHELRTPLNAILGFGQLLGQAQQIAREPAVLARYGSNIVDAGHHLMNLINEILDLARIEAGKLAMRMEDFALAEVLVECQAMIAPLAAQRAMHMEFAPTALHVRADRTRLKQVLLNLLSNAIKYSPDGAVVTTHATVADGLVRIAVDDRGRGLRPEQIAALFQPFNRLGQEAGATEGTGLGLVVTKRIVEAMGGTIGVSSTERAGSTFWIAIAEAAAPTVTADA